MSYTNDAYIYIYIYIYLIHDKLVAAPTHDEILVLVQETLVMSDKFSINFHVRHC